MLVSSIYTGGWTTGVLSSGVLPFNLKMQSDCNLVITDSNGSTLWSTYTPANVSILPCSLMLQNSGSLTVINALDQIAWAGIFIFQIFK